MTQSIHTDAVVQQELASRGIDAKVGVFGEHKVQFGKGLPISLAEIKTPSLPFAGFTRVTRVSRGKAGISKSADDLLQSLTAPGNKLDAGKILSAIKAGQKHFERLNALGQISQTQKDDTQTRPPIRPPRAAGICGPEPLVSQRALFRRLQVFLELIRAVYGMPRASSTALRDPILS